MNLKVVRKVLLKLGLLNFARRIQRRLPAYKAYQKKQITFYKQFLKKGDVCFDIGANIGEKTEEFVLTGAKVISVEPQKECVKELRSLFRNNSKVKIVPHAMGSKPGVQTMYICNSANSFSSLDKNQEDMIIQSGKEMGEDLKFSSKREVKVITIEQLIKKHGTPQFCKIDVEGYEFQVLQALKTPIPNLSFEFVPEKIKTIEKILNHLESINKNSYNLCVGTQTEFQLEKWVTKNALLKQIKKTNIWGDIYVKMS